MACKNCFRPPNTSSPQTTPSLTLGCIASGGHGGKTDEYYCTDGGVVTLCDVHLLNSAVVVWDGRQPMTVKYYNEVYSKKV